MIAVSGRPISASEVQKATGLPKPTCYRLIQTLQEQRLIDSVDGASGFVIGERLIRIALLGKSDIDVRRASAPLLKSAAIEICETVFLARLRNSQVEIIHVEIPDDPSRAYIYPGLGERPLHACAGSKAIAAFADEAFQLALLAGDLPRFTEYTKITADALRAEFATIIQRGFAQCDREFDPGEASVAAPIAIGNIGANFSVGAIGPVRRFEPEMREQLGQRLRILADRIGGAIQLCNVADV